MAISPGVIHVAQRFVGVLAISLAQPTYAAAPTPSASLVDPVARLDYGQAKGQANLLLKVDGLDAAGLSNKELIGSVADLARPEPPKVNSKIAVKELSPVGATSRSWLLIFDVDGLPPSTTQVRWLTLTLAGKDVTLPYTLTNAAVGKFSWSVKALSTVAIKPGDAIQVSIAVAQVPATGVTVFQSALTEKSNKGLIAPRGLELCRSPDGNCAPGPVNLLPNSSNQLWLRGATEVGQYEGGVIVASAEKPEGDSVAMTVYSTTSARRALGVAVIFIGVVLAWLGTVYVRGVINRDQLALPASNLRSALKTLQHKIKVGEQGFAPEKIKRRIKDVHDELSIGNLESNGLPPRPPAFSASSNATTLDGYRKYVQLRADWVQVLKVLVHDGLERAWEAAGAGDPAKVAEAVAAIDALADEPSPPAIDSVSASIRQVLEKMNQDVNTLHVVNMQLIGNLFARQPSRVETPEQLRVEVARLGFLGWIFIMSATTLSGAYILVLGPGTSGFGTIVDFLSCLLWGIGIPAGSQLMQSTSGSIEATFGVSK